MLPDQLRQAAELIRGGDRTAARAQLARLVQSNPESPQAWYLLSLTLDDRARQLECLQRALNLDPKFALAARRLADLSGTPSIPPGAPRSDTSAGRPVTPPPPRPGPFVEGAIYPEPAAPQVEAIPVAVPPDLAAVEASSSAKRGRTGLPTTRRTGLSAGARFGILGALVVLAIAVVGVAFLVERTLRSGVVLPAALPLLSATAAQALPPTWTPTITPTETVVPSPTLEPTPTPSPTLPPPDPTMAASMDRIETEVADIRFVVPKGEVRPILESDFLSNGGSPAEVADQARVLGALGLIKPTYDLFTNILNGLTDSVGGFYLPWNKQLFVIGGRFGGVERWVFSHEYDHALVDQNYNIAGMGVYPKCLANEDRCEAIRALTEGDATLVMLVWRDNYASPRDLTEIMDYSPPRTTMVEQFPPPYAEREAEFPYLQGLTYVKALHDRGSWAAVNAAYQDLPQSTEQILHPSKYFAHESPIDIAAPSLGDVLGADWRSLGANTLGEWKTYLIMGYSADAQIQIDDATASAAARGWGGDSYQVYFDDNTGGTVMAVHWAWDTPADATEFLAVMKAYLNARFRGAVVDRPGAACWSINQQSTCVFGSSRGTLWLLAPDVTVLDAVLTKYPEFQ
jgi:hypothetical protein